MRINGIVFERVSAVLARRTASDLYHSALTVDLDGTRHAIEMAPVLPDAGLDRGQALTGPVGTRWAGRLAIFRYEVRCWPGGEIPDIDESVDSPRLLTESRDTAAELLTRLPQVPPLTWGRDELGVGEMWNSNSVVSWLIERCGMDATAIVPPAGGRAPGWRAGVAVAKRAP